jgi:hypothetical protein
MYKGRLADCLSDYFQKAQTGILKEPGENSFAAVAEKLAAFVGIKAKSIWGWKAKKRCPTGFNKFAVGYYLTLHGYEVIEIIVLPESVVFLGAHICAKRITLDEAASKLGFSKVFDLEKIFVGESEPSAPLLAKIKILANALNEDQRVGDQRGVKVAIAMADLENLIPTLSLLIDATFPKLDIMLEEATVEERRRIREKGDGKMFFEASNKVFKLNRKLSAMCSEKSREALFSASVKEDGK